MAGCEDGIDMMRRLRSLAFVPLLLVVAAAHAQSNYPYLEAFQGLYVGNGNDGAFVNIDGNGTANGPTDPYVAHASFTGMDSLGATQMMTVDGTAYSSSSYGRIHVFGEGTVSNSYYNAANAPYYDGTGDPNPNGSPDQIAVHGNAGWGDSFTYTGFQGTGYKINYYFRLDGSVSGDVQAGLNFSTSALTDDPNGGFYAPRTNEGNALWVTPSYDVVWGTATTVDVDFFAGLTTYVSQYADGSSISGVADYSNTLVLENIVITKDGLPVSGWSMSSASNTAYIQPVPEPASLAALGVGALALIRRRRRV